jgi:hypothetical protein
LTAARGGRLAPASALAPEGARIATVARVLRMLGIDARLATLAAALALIWVVFHVVGAAPS